MVTRTAVSQLTQLLQTKYPRLDSAFLANVAETLFKELDSLQSSGRSPCPVLKLSLREITWIAQEMRRQREAKGWTLSELARHLDKSQTWVIRHEACVIPYNLGDVRNLMHVFGITDKELIAKLEDSVRRNR